MSKKNLTRVGITLASLIGFGALANYTGECGKNLSNPKLLTPEYKQIESRVNFRKEIEKEFSVLEKEIMETKQNYENGTLTANPGKISDEKWFWSSFNRPIVYDDNTKKMIRELSPSNQVLFWSSLPFISLIKKAETKYAMPKENILLPLVIVATESGGNPYCVARAEEIGIGQFRVGSAKSAGFQIDSEFEKYFVKNIELYKETNKFGTNVVAKTLSDLAKANHTNIFEEFEKLEKYDERVDVEKSIDCIVKNISTILRLNKGDAYKLITHYNAGPAWIPRFETISLENKNEKWFQYPVEEITKLFERVRNLYSIEEEKSVFPRNTVVYLRGYEAFKKSFYDKEEQKIIQKIVNLPDSFYDELLQRYKETYKNFFAERVAFFEAKENKNNQEKILKEYSENINAIKKRIKYGEIDFPQLWEIKEKVTKMDDSFNKYKKYFFKINEQEVN